jgi:uncharacterized linocin/CFP29 family protein
MTTDNPQLPWTDEQWARANQVIQEEANRARVAATFLPLIGPLPGGTDFVRRERIQYRPLPAALQPPPARIAIEDRNIWQLATLQVPVRLRGAQMADPESTSALTVLRRAANVVARLEDAVVFRGLIPDPTNPERFRPPRSAISGLQPVYRIGGGEREEGLWERGGRRWVHVRRSPPRGRGGHLVGAVSEAIGLLERGGHFGPFAVVLDQGLFRIAQTPDLSGSVLPQDRIIPFLGGGSLFRSSTLDRRYMFTGLVLALGAAPFELVVATDMSLQFLQVTSEPEFLFRVRERIVLRIKETRAIVQLYMWRP